jgi:hypothetical protein
LRRTGFADGLFTAWQAEGVDGQLAAIGASQFVGDIVGSQRAERHNQYRESIGYLLVAIDFFRGPQVFEKDTPTYLISSA